jgi:glycosyltransferase involved in cell wall biosynthesis
LRSNAQRLGIVERVTFTGFRHDLPDILQVLEVVAHTSVSAEPFGRVITEAMAMRRPVVATCAGGPTEIIEDGCTGFLVPPNDAEALADRLIALLEDQDLAERIAEAGCAQVRRRVDPQVHSKLLEQVYTGVLRPRRRCPASAEGLGRESGR